MKDYYKKYPELLDNFLNTNVSSTSYALNKGISGTGPGFHLESPTFGFEHLEKKHWPNVVSLEYAVNLNHGWENVRVIDDLIRHIIRKYEMDGLKSPSFMLLELPAVRVYSQRIRDSYKKQVDVIPCVQSGGEDRGGLLLLLARFYWIPFISFKEATYNAFIRHYLTFDQSKMWPYLNDDGFHVNAAAHHLLTYEMLVPFLLDNYRPRESDKHPSPIEYPDFFHFNVSLFPPVAKTIEPLEKWRAWGVGRYDFNTLINITVPSEHWGFIRGGRRWDSYCYASERQSFVARFQFKVPPECVGDGGFRCELRMDYLHSWNSSKIGDLICHPPVSDHNASTSFVRIFGNTRHSNDTTVHSTTLFTVSKAVSGADVRFECVKPDNKLSCIAAVALVRYSKSVNGRGKSPQPRPPTDGALSSQTLVSDPTTEELGRAVLVRASDSWGRALRREQSIRLLALGEGDAFLITCVFVCWLDSALFCCASLSLCRRFEHCT